MGILGRRREQRLAEREDFRQVRRVVADDVDDLGARLGDLPGVPDGMVDQQRALELHASARALLSGADDVTALRDVAGVLDEARFHLARLLATEAGRPLPQRREPCAFDPRHGPSVRDVLWTPPGGSPRRMAVCEADAHLVEGGGEPDHRLVRVGDRYVAWWVAEPLRPGGSFDSAAAVAGGRGHLAPGADSRLTQRHVVEAHLRSVQNPDAQIGPHGI